MAMQLLRGALSLLKWGLCAVGVVALIFTALIATPLQRPAELRSISDSATPSRERKRVNFRISSTYTRYRLAPSASSPVSIAASHLLAPAKRDDMRRPTSIRIDTSRLRSVRYSRTVSVPRRAVAPAFRHENILGLVPVFYECADAQARAWRAKAETDNVRKQAEANVAKAHKYAVERFALESVSVSPGTFDRTAILERCPASRATATISTGPSAISGTSLSNRRRRKSGCVRDMMTCGPLAERSTVSTTART